MIMPIKSNLYYVHDPMCSWCWAFRPTWEKIEESLSDHIPIQYVLGGLAPDTYEPMPEVMQAKIASIWESIQVHVPGTEFNFEFWRLCRPRRSTFPACRAVIAAKNQGDEFEKTMVLAIQRAYYLDAKNPSDDSTLADLAESIGLRTSQFLIDLNSKQTQNELDRQIKFSRQIGAPGFPSLIIGRNGIFETLQFDYNNAAVVLNQFERLLETGGPLVMKTTNDR